MTPNIQAISIAPSINLWINNSVIVRVLHIFEKACNLINQQGDVISIVGRHIGNGPFNIVVPSNKIFQFLNTETTVKLESKMIHLDNYRISIDGSVSWNPTPDWPSLQKITDYMILSINKIEKILSEESPLESFARISTIPSVSHNIPEDVFAVANAAITKLGYALAIVDAKRIQEAAHKLAGLGSGLTPAGDDFLMGVMHGVWSVLPNRKAIEISNTISSVSIARTSSLSAAWLNAAARGEAGEPWHDLFKSIIANNKDEIMTSARKILPTGHSSGADALGGFVHAIRSITQ